MIHECKDGHYYVEHRKVSGEEFHRSLAQEEAYRAGKEVYIAIDIVPDSQTEQHNAIVADLLDRPAGWARRLEKPTGFTAEGDLT